MAVPLLTVNRHIFWQSQWLHSIWLCADTMNLWLIIEMGKVCGLVVVLWVLSLITTIVSVCLSFLSAYMMKEIISILKEA